MRYLTIAADYRGFCIRLWSKDNADHGGSKFKVFKEGSKGLNWEFDANASGEKILNKHKGPIGLFIPFKELIIL